MIPPPEVFGRRPWADGWNSTYPREQYPGRRRMSGGVKEVCSGEVHNWDISGWRVAMVAGFGASNIQSMAETASTAGWTVVNPRAG